MFGVSLSCKNEVKRIDGINEINSTPDKTEKVKNNKFAYVFFTLESPRLVHTEPTYVTRQGALAGTTYQERIEGSDYVEWDKKAFTTGIIEMEDYNEDEKYKLLDKAEYEYKQAHYPIIDAEFESSLYKINDYNKAEELKKNRTKIIKREVLVFNTYAEASKSKY